MADAYANPIMVDALIHSRAGTTETENKLYAPALDTKSIDTAADVERWEPWVRAYTALGELLQGIVFTFNPSAHEVTVNFRTFDTSTGGTTTYPIAAINRPPQAVFQAQLPLVASWAELRNERATEIVAQIDPQFAFWSSIVYLHPDRTRRTFELINIVLQFCVYVEMRFKHALACWRPVEYNAQIQPMITTPGHGSFPSGHATQAHAVAYVLDKLLNLNAKHSKIQEQFKRQTARIATNRVVAGVHFPIDSMAGRMLGTALGEFFVARCGQGSQFMFRTMDCSCNYLTSLPAADFNPYLGQQDLNNSTAGLYTVAAQTPQAGSTEPQQASLLLKHLWTKAEDEWRGRLGR